MKNRADQKYRNTKYASKMLMRADQMYKNEIPGGIIITSETIPVYYIIPQA